MIILCHGIKETVKEVVSKHCGTELSHKQLRKEKRLLLRQAAVRE